MSTSCSSSHPAWSSPDPPGLDRGHPGREVASPSQGRHAKGAFSCVCVFLSLSLSLSPPPQFAHELDPPADPTKAHAFGRGAAARVPPGTAGEAQRDLGEGPGACFASRTRKMSTERGETWIIFCQTSWGEDWFHLYTPTHSHLSGKPPVCKGK